MGDARDRLAERRHLLGLQHLVAAVAALILTLLALADVANERFNMQHRELRLIRMHRPMGCDGRDFDPDRGAVDTTDAHDVIHHLAVAIEELDEGLARLRIDEARLLERQDDVLGRVRRIAEDRLEMRIGGERRRAVGAEGAHVDTLVNSLKQTRER